ncbi:Hint domain-containing protein [Thioclava sp.]|uniref:Hint domain-containing protein n=1 Tax=Thioclava sp. TaxID=1933450 RepID=UPI003AA95856
MATYYDQFYYIDPGNPPDAGTSLTPQTLEITDRNNDDWISYSGADRIDGSRVDYVWRGDTITVQNENGREFTITGDTFYLRNGDRVFTPSDGSILHNATFVSSTYVTTSTQAPVGDLGPECFAAGSLIDTPSGPTPVEWLRQGDLVLTRDNGAQPILWTGGRFVEGTGKFAPVRFETGVIGNRRPLLVSQQHRILIEGWRAELACGTSEVLVAAKHLVNGQTIRVTPVPRLRYIHVLLDAHHVLSAEGAPCESLFPGEMILDEDRAIYGEIRDAWAAHHSDAIETMVTARQVARGAEVSLLAA